MTKSLQLLKELLEEDKLDIKEVMEVLGYEIVQHEETDVFIPSIEDVYFDRYRVLVGYDEVITIKKEFR